MGKKIAIITGATGGIGREFTKVLMIEDLDEIWAVARNKEKLDLLKAEFGNKIIPLQMDLSKTEHLQEIGSLLEEMKPNVLFLINNASLAKMGLYKDFTIKEIEDTINVNCKAPVVLSNLCIPYMKNGGRIINMSSASAFQPNPYINLYAASKAFERNYSRALNVEISSLGITVTAACPGWVDTNMLTKTINGHTVKFPGMVTTKKVVEKAMKDAKKGSDMSICTFYMRCQYVIVKLMPHKFIMKIWMNGLKKYL